MKHYRRVMSIRPEDGINLWFPFLLNEVILARATSETPFYLISPWVTDFALDLSAGRGVSELGIQPGKFTLSDFCRAYIRAGGRMRILAYYPEIPSRRGRNVKETLRLLKPLGEHPSGRVEVRLHKKLHVKLYVGQAGVMSGSANATISGVHYNVENLYYFAADDDVENHRDDAERLWEDVDNLVDWNSVD